MDHPIDQNHTYWKAGSSSMRCSLSLTSSTSVNEGDSMASFEATGSTPSRFPAGLLARTLKGFCCRSLLRFALIQANPTCPAVCCFRLTAIYLCSPPTDTFAWLLQIEVLNLWRTISRTLFNGNYFKISVYTWEKKYFVLISTTWSEVVLRTWG